MTTHRYTLHKISTLPLAKFGWILGGTAMLLPSLICALLNIRLVTALHILLDNWQGSEIEILGTAVPFDFINLLGLQTAQSLFTRLDDQKFIMALLIILSGVIGGGLLIGFLILLLGWIYNALARLTGGIIVELKESADSGQ